MKTKLLIFLSSIVMASFLQASVTLQIRTVLGDDEGIGTNSMFWGVLVDSTGNGFEVTPTGTIDPFDFSSDGTFGENNYFVADSTTSTFAPFGGVGVASNVSSVALSGAVGTGDAFGLFWTDGAGHYGFVTETGATLPSDGSNSNYSTIFTSDPYAQLGTIPEPSSYALLGGLFALTCVMLRRRA